MSSISEDDLKFWNYIFNCAQNLQYFTTNSYYKVYTISTTSNNYMQYVQTLPVYKQETVQKHQDTDSNLKKLIKQASEQIAEVVQQRVCLI